jgi:hypothetical protein
MKLSDVLKDIRLNNYKLTGNLRADLGAFCEKEHYDINESGNIIAYRLSFGDTLTVHTLTDGVSKRVVNTRIETLPAELPEKLKQSFLFEAKDNGVLFDDIVAIGGFLLDGDLVLLSAYKDGNTIWQHEKGAYDGRNLKDIQFDREPDKEIHGKQTFDRATRKDTFAFITVLALMLEAERTPILVDGGSKKARKRNNNKKDGQAGWIERRIYIDARYAAKRSEDPVPMDRDGKIKRDVYIQGFLRHQQYGPKHGLRKWVYIEGFESSRWANTGDKKITVDIKNNA